MQEIDNRIKDIESNIDETFKEINTLQKLQNPEPKDFMKLTSFYRDISTWQCETDALRNIKLRLINSMNEFPESQDDEQPCDYTEE